MNEVPPILLSAIICERTIFDKITGMPSLINILQTFNAPKFPLRCSSFVFFCEMTNGHGKTNTKVRLVDAQKDEKVIFEQNGTVKFENVRQVLTLAINLRGVVFEAPGEYRLQLLSDDCLLGERKIICRKLIPPPKPGTDTNVQNND